MITATWNEEHLTLVLSAPDKPDIIGRIEGGDFAFRSDGAPGAGGYRFFLVKDGGGHYELAKPGSLPATGAGMVEVGEDGRAVIHDA